MEADVYVCVCGGGMRGRRRRRRRQVGGRFVVALYSDKARIRRRRRSVKEVYFSDVGL